MSSGVKAHSVVSYSSYNRRSVPTSTFYPIRRTAYSVVTGYNPRISASSSHQQHQITAVEFNKSLLAHLNVEFDTKIQAVRTHEKEQIKSLNNQFATFIDTVCHLEQQNKKLETELSLLQQPTTTCSNNDGTFNTRIVNLRRHLDGLENDKVKLESQLNNIRVQVKDFKEKYEDEINKRTKAEKEFGERKKEADEAYMEVVRLDAEVQALQYDINFRKAIYEAEISEAKGRIKGTAVIVEMNNSRNLDMDAIIAQVRAQYEDIANRSRAEAESWYKQKYEEMQKTSAGQYGDDLRTIQAEITKLESVITSRQKEINKVKGKPAALDAEIAKAEDNGDQKVKDTNDCIKQLEEALQKAKQAMTNQVREYQKLLNIKMALDIEIATYRTLLEGEESRLSGGGASAVIHVQQTSSPRPSIPYGGYGSGAITKSRVSSVSGTSYYQSPPKKESHPPFPSETQNSMQLKMFNQRVHYTQMSSYF